MIRLLVCVLCLSQSLTAQSFRLYVGTFSQRGSAGIYTFEFNEGHANQLATMATQDSPSFLALHPGGGFLYAANRSSVVTDQPEWGSVSAFKIDPATGHLTLLNEATSKGSGACHVAISPQGDVLAVSNYNAGSVVWYQIMEDGSIGQEITHIQHVGRSANEARQAGPHAHAAIPSADGRFWYVSDLGMDAVITYHQKNGQFEEKSRFTSVPGSGPRHFTISNDGRHAYSIEELSSTIQVFRRKNSGKLKPLQRLSTMETTIVKDNICADIHWHPSGQFLAGSNRGANTIALFKPIEKGQLAFIKQIPSGGDWPRNFGFSPDGKYLLAGNERSDEIVVYKIDLPAMKFEEVNRVKVPGVACIIFSPIK